MSNTVYIISAARTAIGSFQGKFADVPAPQLGSSVIQEALKRAHVNKDQIEECIMGQVLTAGVGQAPARQAAIYAGLNKSTPCMTINKVCGSGLKSVMLAADGIQLGGQNILVAGGQENMTLAPHLMEKARSGFRMGKVEMADSMIKDGLWDPYSQFHMGSAAEICAKKYAFSRQSQDEFAVESYKRAQKASQTGAFSEEIIGVEITVGKAKELVQQDEEPFKTNFDKIPTLKPVFEKDGTVTAANASKINDGAAAVVVASAAATQKWGLKPMAKILGYSTFAQDPTWFTTAPAGAIQKVLQQTNLSVSDIDLWEINEAFAVVAMAAMQDLKIPHDRINVNGGAVALGHPIGASGARLLTTLIYALKNQQKQIGLATLCIGGGEAVAMIVERV